MNDLRPRIKYNTYLTKVHIIETKIIPYFAKKSISEITAPDILQWQNELLKKSDGEGKSYSQTYLRTIQNQLNAILNHANKYYGLTSNPAHKTTKMGKSKAQEMLFWTKEEYENLLKVLKASQLHIMPLRFFIGVALERVNCLHLQKMILTLRKKFNY